MNEPREPHEGATLLPFYINGTLTPEERERVEAHVASCAACDRELRFLQRLQPAVAEAVESRPGPSPTFSAQMAARITARTAELSPARRDGGTRWFHLIPPRLAPALAVALIILQFGALAVLGTILYRTFKEPGFTTASGPAAVTSPGGQGVRLRVAFRETASERDIRAILLGVDGHIVEGPTAAGFYVIEAPAGKDPQKIVQALERKPSIIRFVEPLAP